VTLTWPTSCALILCFIVYLVLRHYYPDSRNTIVITISLAVYDIVTDILFINSQQASQSVLFIPALVFLVVPILFNVCVLGYTFVTSVLKEGTMETWLEGNYALAAITAIMSTTNVEVFNLLQSNLFGIESFRAPFPKRSVRILMICGLVTNVMEDIPQLITQILAASSGLDTITLLSIVASLLTISFGIVKRLMMILIFRFGFTSRELKKQRAASGKESMVLDVLTEN